MRLQRLYSSVWLILTSLETTSAFSAPVNKFRRSNEEISFKADPLAQDELERTATHLKKLTNKSTPRFEDRTVELAYRSYLVQPATSLKELLKARKLPRNGRKPDLAMRLAQFDFQLQTQGEDAGEVEPDHSYMKSAQDDATASISPASQFAGLPRLSETAGKALAGFMRATPIQVAAIPTLARGESCILHAPTGSGKTLAFLLPLTESVWFSKQSRDQDGTDDSIFVVVTPTRELASQIAGIATVLAPPGSVRFISRPTDLSLSKDRSEQARIFIGSAKAVMQSLYGDSNKMPVAPTPKPSAMQFLSQVRCLVMDEVDRLLLSGTAKTTRASKSRHEKPAAIVCAAVARLTLGQAQIVASSATTGRPLRRELSRVLGLPPQECPPVIVGKEDTRSLDEGTRAVTIPDTVEHFVWSSGESASPGQLLIAANSVIRSLVGNDKSNPPPILLVLTKGFGMNIHNTIGALKHFGCEPEPRNLLDLLEADSDSEMLEVYREVAGADGVGRSTARKGYLLVTGEDSVRGLHLDGLEHVVVVGRANGPDEYTHIAGRTGRAGRAGKVINVLSDGDARKLVSWSRMLNVNFDQASEQVVSSWNS